MRVAAIVPAAGRGRRIKSRIHKPYIRLSGRPIIVHTLLKLSKNRNIAEIVVAADEKKVGTLSRIINKYGIKKTRIVSGGKERKDSVFNAIKDISGNIDYILIHDSVRPFISDNLIDSSLRAAQRFGASVVGVPVKSTLKYVGKDKHIRYTPDRSNFWEAQTPQVFRRDLIEKAYKRAGKKTNITDDSMLMEQIGIRPRIVLGSYSNIKITTKEDLELAKALCHAK